MIVNSSTGGFSAAGVTDIVIWIINDDTNSDTKISFYPGSSPHFREI